MHGLKPAATARPAPSRRRLPALSGDSILLPIAVLVGLLIIVTIRNPQFLSLGNLQVQASTAAPILLLAAGQTLVILVGGIDLSTAAIAALATITVSMWLVPLGIVGVMAALALSTAIGLANGVVHVYFQVPSFIVTLGALGLASGLAQVLSNNHAISIDKGYDTISWMTGLTGTIPNDGVIAVGLVIIVGLVLRYLPGGHLVKAIGSGELAAMIAGVATKRIKIIVFACSGLASGLAGLMLTAQNIGGDPAAAKSLLMPSIAAVLLGGTAITGGRGGMLRTVIGALIITVLRDGLGLLGVPDAYTQIIYGVVVIGAVAASLDRRPNQIVW
jgi:ribose transport system permease protein